MTAPLVVADPTVCRTCDGDQTVVVEVRGVDVEAPCPGCCCEICGATTPTPPECLTCFADNDHAYRRRTDR